MTSTVDQSPVDLPTLIDQIVWLKMADLWQEICSQEKVSSQLRAEFWQLFLKSAATNDQASGADAVISTQPDSAQRIDQLSQWLVDHQLAKLGLMVRTQLDDYLINQLTPLIGRPISLASYLASESVDDQD